MLLKQETCCYLAGLDPFSCSETIESISILGTTKLGSIDADKNTFLRRYADRGKDLHHLSLTQYFYHSKNTKFDKNQFMSNYFKKGPIHQGKRKFIIPHFTGCSTDNEYPPTENFAKSVFVRHVPWHGKFDVLQTSKAETYLDLFNVLITNPRCPLQVSISYERSKQQYLTMYRNRETTSKEKLIDYSNFSIDADDETKTLVTLLNTVTARFNDTDEYDKLLDYGKNFDWSTVHEKVSCISSLEFILK